MSDPTSHQVMNVVAFVFAMVIVAVIVAVVVAGAIWLIRRMF